MKKLWFNNKIALRLTGYFSIVIVLFAIIIGSTFAYFFQQNTVNLHKREMGKAATHLAQMIAEFTFDNSNMRKNRQGHGMGHGPGQGYGKWFMSLLNSSDFGDIWIVDQELNLLIKNQPNHHAYTYKDLPDDAENVVKSAFAGSVTYSEGFSSLLDTPTVTTGAPIYDMNSNVIGVVLLHSPIAGIDEAIEQGVSILIASIIIALLSAIVLAIILSIAFTKPLNRMNQTAMLLADGDYQARTQVKQNDEIGNLAATIDLLGEQLHLARLEQAKLDKLRQDFIANISHELRTPITVLRGSLDALCDKIVSEPAEVEQYHQEMLAETVYLQRLTNDLLDLSRLQNTDFKIEMDTIDLCEVICEVDRLGQKLVIEKNLVLATALDQPFLEVRGDYGRLRQLLIILLDNAIKFSDGSRPIELTLQNNQVTLANYGTAIARADLPYIFERFYKSRNEANKTGTGLGLAIAKQIAERHNIKIIVASDDNGKTVFTLILDKIVSGAGPLGDAAEDNSDRAADSRERN